MNTWPQKKRKYYAKSAKREAAERARDSALEALKAGGLRIKQSEESLKGGECER